MQRGLTATEVLAQLRIIVKHLSLLTHTLSPDICDHLTSVTNELDNELARLNPTSKVKADEKVTLAIRELLDSGTSIDGGGVRVSTTAFRQLGRWTS